MTLRKSAKLPRDLWEEAVFFVLQTARVSKFIEIVYYIIETRLRLTVLRRKIFAKDSTFRECTPTAKHSRHGGNVVC